MSRVISTGSIIVDLTVTVPAVPEPGGDVLASPLQALVGGGFNLAAAASRHGAHVVYAGVIGTGPYGQLASAALAAEGITRIPGAAATGDTGVCITLVDENAERTFITSPGAESRLAPEHLDAVRPQAADVVCVSGYDAVYEDSRNTLTEWVMSLPLGTTIIFDPGPLVADIPEPVWNALLARTDVLTLNEQEAEKLTPGSVPAEQHFALRERLRLRPSFAVVPPDARGARTVRTVTCRRRALSPSTRRAPEIPTPEPWQRHWRKDSTCRRRCVERMLRRPIRSPGQGRRPRRRVSTSTACCRPLSTNGQQRSST